MRVEALAFQAPDRTRVLVANLSAERQTAALTGVPSGETRLRRLTAETAEVAALAPEQFRAAWTTLPPADEPLPLALTPYEVVCLDVLTSSAQA